MGSSSNMRLARIALLGILTVFASVTLSGCQHSGAYTFGPSRKLMDSGAPDVTKGVFIPFLVLYDSFTSPATAYIDAAENAKTTTGHIYLSYIGTRTVWKSNMEDFYIYAALPATALLDSIWFLGGGLLDVGHVLMNE